VELLILNEMKWKLKR